MNLKNKQNIVPKMFVNQSSQEPCVEKIQIKFIKNLSR